MRFQNKLLLVALAILVFTLLLSSLLSLASFAKIYSASLISTYEVSGKSLQRKIQSALRFGKPLAGFAAMDELLDEVQKGDADIVRIDVVAPDKNLLYTTGEESRADASPYAGEYPEFADLEAPAVVTKLIGGSYVTFLPLHDRRKRLVGFLNLEFPREAVYRQLKSMAWDNLKTLSVLILGAVVILTLLIHKRVSRPIELKLRTIVDNIGARSTDPSGIAEEDEAGWPDKEQRDEFDELYQAVVQIARESHQELEQYRTIDAAKLALEADLHDLDDAMVDLEPTQQQAAPAVQRAVNERHAELRSQLEALVTPPRTSAGSGAGEPS